MFPIKNKVMAIIVIASMFGLAACDSGNEESEIIVETSLGQNITKEDFYQELKKHHGKEVLDRMVNELVLSNKYKVSEEDIDDEIEKVKNELGDQFGGWLQQQGFDNEDLFRDFVRMSNLSEKAAFEDIEVSEKEIKEHYNRLKTEIKTQHILVEDKETAEEVMTKLDEGADFVDLAKEYSADTSTAEDGGDLGFVSIGQMIPEFEVAAFKLEMDEVSNPVQTQYGFHIIKVTDERDKENIEPFEAVEEDIRRELQSEKFDPTTAQEKINNLLIEADVDVKLDEFNDLFNTDEPDEKG